MSPPLTVLVNSTDSYRDCWAPFFTLFSRYWPDCPYPVVLNTEQQEFSWPRVDVRATQVARVLSQRDPSWSECLEAALEACPTDLILYMQEDYFLRAPVRSDLLDEFATRMTTEHIDCIRLLECDNAGPWLERDDDIWPVDKSALYRMSLQAGLWRKTALQSLLRRHENPWQLEVWGSRRVNRKGLKIYSVNRHRFMGAGTEIIPYVPTGVVKGRWDRDVVESLFSKEAIKIDFSERGFVAEVPGSKARKPLQKRLWDRIRSL